MLRGEEQGRGWKQSVRNGSELSLVFFYAPLAWLALLPAREAGVSSLPLVQVILDFPAGLQFPLHVVGPKFLLLCCC